MPNVMDSDGDAVEFPTLSFGPPIVPEQGAYEDGSIIDAEIVEDKPLFTLPPRDPKITNREPKTGPPNLDEWTDFFSRVVLRLATDWYVSYSFRGIDEDQLSQREIERLRMKDDERANIARPFAELSNKSKFMRKHGRTVVASADSLYAVVAFGTWASRVNRIARKYRPVRGQQQRRPENGNPGQAPLNGNEFLNGANGGHIIPGLHIVNPGSN